MSDPNKPIDLANIGDDEIEGMFTDIQDIHEDGTNVTVSSDLDDTVPIDFGKPQTDHEVWWVGLGQCPVCKDGTKPESIIGGFICPKCNWRN